MLPFEVVSVYNHFGHFLCSDSIIFMLLLHMTSQAFYSAQTFAEILALFQKIKKQFLNLKMSKSEPLTAKTAVVGIADMKCQNM